MQFHCIREAVCSAAWDTRLPVTHFPSLSLSRCLSLSLSPSLTSASGWREYGGGGGRGVAERAICNHLCVTVVSMFHLSVFHCFFFFSLLLLIHPSFNSLLSVCHSPHQHEKAAAAARVGPLSHCTSRTPQAGEAAGTAAD